MSLGTSTGIDVEQSGREKDQHFSTMPVGEQGRDDGGLRQRAPLVTKQINFAGRIGGNQDFVVDPSTTQGEEVLKKQPDAAPISSISEAIDISGFSNPDNWRGAIVEGWGTCLVTYVLGMMSSAVTTLTTSALANILYGALANSIGLTLFLYSAGPVSGGHLNPSITMATFFTGLCTLPRAILYIVAQSLGAIIGAYWLKLSLGDSFFPNNWIPGCTVGIHSPNPAPISIGELFVLEFMLSQALIFIAYGSGLDPRNAKTLGPALSPILVGLSLGFGSMCSGLVKPGYTGVSFNPARCLGLMNAWGDMQYHYIHWLGPLSAAIVNGLFYYFAPPYKQARKRIFNIL